MRNGRGHYPQKPEKPVETFIERKIIWPAEKKIFEKISTAFFIVEGALELCAAPFVYALKKIRGKKQRRSS